MKDRAAWSRRLLLFWCLFIGIGAVGGSAGMLLDITGGLMGMTPLLPYFQVLPFADALYQDFLFPGIALLLVNGVTNLTAAVLILRRRKSGILLGTIFGVTLMLWITIQFVIFPANILSTAYFLFGLLQFVTGCVCLIRIKQAAFRFEPERYRGIDPASDVLVAYYSRGGYTKKIAYEAADRLGAAVYEIRAREYTEGTRGFWWCGRFGMHKWPMSIEEPEITWEHYRKIVVCTPVWVFSVAAPVRAFCGYARGRIAGAAYISTHFMRARLSGVFDELDRLLNVRRAWAYSVTVRMGETVCAAPPPGAASAVSEEARDSGDAFRRCGSRFTAGTDNFAYRRGAKTDGRSVLPDAGKTLLIFAALTAVGLLLQRLQVNEANLMMLYIIGVLITASVVGNRIYSIAYSVCSLLGFNFFFTDPKFSFSAYDPSYPLTFLLLFLASLMTETLVNRIKTQARQAETTAYRTAVLLETSQLIQKEKDESGIVTATARQLLKLFGKTVYYYAVDGSGLKPAEAYSNTETPEAAKTDDGRLAAEQVLRRAGTEPQVSDAGLLCFPIRTAVHTFGVLGIALGTRPLDVFEAGLATSIIGECALALEKEYYNLRREEAAIWARNEQMRADLLRSISHDLRTPLTSISGSARVLMTGSATINEARKQELYTDIYEESMWLIDLVENLLSVTQMEGGKVSLHIKDELVDEVIGEALRHVNLKSAAHTIRVKQEDVCLMAKMDARLIVQVLVNIVNNAVKYTQPGSEIVIHAARRADAVVFEIADNGKGIVDEAKSHVFEMFFTAGSAVADSRRGLGLGLALCQTIVQAHGGEIGVRDNVPHGTVFQFTLPAADMDVPPEG